MAYLTRFSPICDVHAFCLLNFFPTAGDRRRRDFRNDHLPTTLRANREAMLHFRFCAFLCLAALVFARMRLTIRLRCRRKSRTTGDEFPVSNL